MSELFTLAGHQSNVSGLSFSADGRLLASAGSSDATVRIWDLAAGMELHTLKCTEGDNVCCVALAPDGKTVVAGRKYQHPYGMHVWDVQSGKQLASWKEDGMVNAVAFAPDGSIFAAGLYTGKIKLFDTATQQERNCLLEDYSPVSALAFSPNGQKLVSGADNGEVRLWDVARGKQRLIRNNENSPIYGSIVGLAFTPDGTGLFIGLTDSCGGVLRWDLTTYKPVETFPSPKKADVYDVVKHLAVSPDGQLLAVASANGTIKWLDAATARLLATAPADEAHVNVVAFAPDGKSLASGGYEPVVKFWDVAQVRK